MVPGEGETPQILEIHEEAIFHSEFLTLYHFEQ